jgi:hypothetical protein
VLAQEVGIRGLAIKFPDWGGKRNKKYKGIKIGLFIFKIISDYLNTFVVSFKKFLKIVSKGLERNSVQFGHHVFLNVFNILKLQVINITAVNTTLFFNNNLFVVYKLGYMFRP